MLAAGGLLLPISSFTLVATCFSEHPSNSFQQRHNRQSVVGQEDKFLNLFEIQQSSGGWAWPRSVYVGGRIHGIKFTK